MGIPTIIQRKVEKNDLHLRDENFDLTHIQEDISKTKQILEDEFKDFDPEAKRIEITKINQEIAALVIDPDLDDKFTKAQRDLHGNVSRLGKD